MPKSPGTPKHRRKIAGGLLVLLGGLLILAVCVDGRMKRAPHAGYLPGNATWRLYAPDVAPFWQAWDQSPGGRALAKEAPFLFQSLERGVRMRTGIRPTPERWRIWLGQSLLLGGDRQTWGGCVHPGLLFRIAAWATGVEDTGTWKGWRYAWRDGFLIFSPSAEYIAAALKGPPIMGEGMAAMNADQVEFVWRPASAGFRLSADATLSIEGWSGRLLAAAPADGAPPSPSVPVGWGDSPILAMALSSPESGSLLLQELGRWMPDNTTLPGRLLEQAGQHWPAAPFWKQGDAGKPSLPPDFCAALYGVSTQGPLVIPEGAFCWQAAGQPPNPEGALPFSWEGRQGWMQPVLGDAYSWCCAVRKDWCFAATRESRMARIIQLGPPRERRSAELALEADWSKMAAAAMTVINQYASQGAIPGINDPRELESQIFPLLRALGALHHAELLAGRQNGEWRVKGHVAGGSSHE